jgi:uncharacterized membrane protein
MPLTQPMRAVGVFNRPNNLEAALEELRASDFPMAQISVIGRDAERRIPVDNKAQDITTTGAIAGGAVGGVVGLLIGLGTLAAIPGVGPVAFLGAAATALATTLTTGVLGATAGGLLGALISYGIPEDQATVYRDRIHQGDYFVMVEGSEADVRQAEAILARWHVQELRIYNATEPYAIPRPTDSVPPRSINTSSRSL